MPMPSDQLEFIFQFCIRVAGMLAVTAVDLRIAREVFRPRGTYGPGLPERRSRPRYVVPNPAPVRNQDIAANAA